MNNQEQTSRPLPNTLTKSGREARREARANGTLQAWQCAIGDIRGLLTAARHGEDVEENLDMAFSILERLRLIVEDRFRYACSCKSSQNLEQSLLRLDGILYGAMMDILQAAVMAEDEWGGASPVKGHITSALRQVPTLVEIGRLAPELGSVPVADVMLVPMVRQGAPMRCRYCGG